MAESSETVVPLPEFHSFVVRVMKAVGVADKDADALADLLVSADYRGHYSHGLNRLDMYVTDVTSGTTDKEGEPKIIKETVATALVDGNNILGPSVGKFCIDLAIEKAKEAGVGWVSTRGSNHFGIAGWYGMRAAEQGMLGMAFCNTSPLLVPTRAKQVTLGTNPINLAAPAKDGDSFVLDMATTAVALGKVELAERKDEDIPDGWAVDASGKSTTDPKKAQGLRPLGGAENTSGYKGYGLSMMVEIFCGILSGASYGPHVRKWKESHLKANLGQCFVAINPNAFEDGFTNRMSELMSYCRNLEPAEGETEVLVAGDPERKHMTLCDKLGGIPYHKNQITFANELAARLKVDPMKTLRLLHILPK